MTGTVLSTTVFFIDVLRPLPLAPLFPYTTLFRSPGRKVSPGLWFEVSVAPGQLSEAVGGVQLATLLQVVAPGPVLTEKLDGVPTSAEHTSALPSPRDDVGRPLLVTKNAD